MEEEKICVEHVRTEDQLADILTKSLALPKFIEMRDKIGLRPVRSRVQDKRGEC